MEKPERLNLQSADGAQLNLDALYQICPSCFTEATDPKTGEVKHMVNFNTLRQLLGDNAVEDAPEAYMFNWVGKQAARAEVLRPTKKTLRPVKEDSVDWDNTQNLYIEGDNLEVLKLLQKSYLGKVKMIYIDPPYNTGNDFVYHDDFARTQAEEDLFAGNVDDLGNRYIKNPDTNGRFHSDWCSMIYSRLMVARTLLSEDGVIFISIDDNEVDNLRKICNEILGESNFIGCVSWHRNYASANDAKKFANVIDYVMVYSKSSNYVRNLLPRTEKQNHLYKYDSNDGKGRWRSDNLSVRTYSQSYDYPIVNPNTGVSYNPPSGRCWMTNKETILKWIDEKRVFFGQNGKGAPQLKRYLNEVQNGVVPTTYWSYDDCGHNDEARKEIKDLFVKPPFDSPKPTRLLKQIVRIGANDDSLILDFFSGSATTAHAIMQLNAEDGGKRKYIMVQLPEETPEDSEARKSGYNTIPEIGKERIRRAGKKIKEEHPEAEDLDIGFRVFRLDEGNFEDVEFSPNNLQQAQLELFLNNIKSDRNDLDLLFGCMLDWGVLLSLPMTSEVVDGKTIYTVNDGDLVACFAENVTDDVVRAMANKMPLRVIFRDSCFAQDADKINIYETFKQLLDWSDQEVIKNIRVI